MGISDTAKNIASVLTLGGMMVTGFLFLETRHVSASDFNKLTEQFMRSEIREVEKALREEDDPEVLEMLEEDLDTLLDEYCAEVDDRRRCEDE